MKTAWLIPLVIFSSTASMLVVSYSINRVRANRAREMTLNDAVEVAPINVVLDLINGQHRDPNEKFQNGETALFTAVRKEDAQMALLLIENGSDPYVVNSTGINAMELARSKNLNQLSLLMVQKFNERVKGK